MIKSEICYDSRDGVSKINALRYEPDNKADVRAVVQIVHGMAEYAERYEESDMERRRRRAESTVISASRTRRQFLSGMYTA